MKKETDELGLAAVYLARALKEGGCPICRRVRESEERWIWTVLYELTGDPELHEKFAQSLGLCREHAALMAQVVEIRELVTPTSVARLYETAVSQVLQNLPRPNRGPCPLCELAEEAAERESFFLGKLLLDPEFWGAFQRSDGLCLPHFLRVWRLAPRKNPAFSSFRPKGALPPPSSKPAGASAQRAVRCGGEAHGSGDPLLAGSPLAALRDEFFRAPNQTGLEEPNGHAE